MHSPAIRIVSILLILILAITVHSFVTLGNGWEVLMLLLGATIGPVMGISYPFTIEFKVIYIFGFITSIIAIVIGIKKCANLYGQILVVLGVVAWVVLGTVGLGTGT